MEKNNNKKNLQLTRQTNSNEGFKSKLTLVRNVNNDGIEQNIIEFYAAVYNQESKIGIEDGNKVKEIINKDAFLPALNAKDINIIATVFHDKTKILGRTKSGTLNLISDEYGLKCLINMGNTTLSKDTIEQIKRGDLFECSFIGYTTDYQYIYKEDYILRIVNTIDMLEDVSIVGDGRYSNTLIMKRDNNNNLKSEEIKIENDLPVDNTDNEPVKTNTDNETDVKPEKEVKKETEVNINVNVEIEKNKDGEEEEETPEEEKNEGGESEPLELINNKKENKKENKMDNKIKMIRDAFNNGSSIILNNGGLQLVNSGETTTTTASNMIPVAVAPISIKGKELAWEKLGVDYYPNAHGMITLPYKNPAVGEKVAELATLTKDTISPSGNILTGKRYGYTFEYSIETLANATDDFFSKILADGQKAALRAFESDLYNKVVAAANATTSDLTKSGFDTLLGSVDTDNDVKLIANRKTAYIAKGVAVDPGSGKFLVENISGNIGTTVDGTEFVFSTNFKNPDGSSFVVAGDFSEGLAVADYGRTEVIFDKFSRARDGVVEVTINVIMDSALRNPTLFYKSADLGAI